MKLSALTFVALAALGLAQSTENRCDTTEGSPMLHHVNWLIDNTAQAEIGEGVCTDHSLMGEANKCGPTKKDWSGEGGGAAFQLCKGWNGEQGFRCQAVPVGPPPVGMANSGLSIREVSGYLASLRDDCTRTIDGVERAGGRVIFDGGSAVLKLIRMPG